MSATPRFAWQHGAVRPLQQCTVSVLDRGLLFAESIYEVVPVVSGLPRLLDAHVDRMRRGAAVLGIEDGVPDRATWATLATALCEAEGVREAALYAQVTGGAGPRAHVPEPRPEPGFFAFAMGFVFPRTLGGLALASTADPRWARSDLKSTMLLPSVLAKRAAAKHAAEEVVFFDADERLTEGGSTSVMIVEAGRLVVVPESNALLPGITRGVVEEAARAAGIGVATEVISRARLEQADEVLVASTTKLVMSVHTLDGQPAGRTEPVVTRRLFDALREIYGLG